MLDGESVGQLEDGQFELSDLSPGEHTLEVTERSAKAAITFEVRPGAIPVIHEPIQTSSLKVAAVGSLGTAARVYSDSGEAPVLLDGQQAGQITADGLGLTSLQDGSHEVQLGEGNSQMTLAFQAGGIPTLAAFLKSDRNVGGLRIITGEDDVVVYLNGTEYRRKTQRGRLLVYLYPREYKVRIEKPGFEPVEEQVAEVRRGEETRLEFAMRALPETATLTIRNAPAGAEVLIDGGNAGTIAAGSNSAFTLKAGAHTVSLRRQGYKPKEWKLQLKPGEPVELDGALLSAVGVLEIIVQPDGIDPLLTLRRDRETEERPVTGRRLTLPEGTYTVTGRAEGYQEYAATVRVVADETKSATLTLTAEQTITGRSVNLMSELAGRDGWESEGKLLTRTGGDFVLLDREPAPGYYQFTVLLQSGRRLEWVAHFRDERNYALFQIDRSNFNRVEVADGRRERPVRVKHGMDRNEFLSIRMQVTQDGIVHYLYRNQQWEKIDDWQQPGTGFWRGRVGFHVPGRDKIGLSSFTFTAQ